MTSSTLACKVIIRSVALPSEHGGWGFVLEPIVLGLLVAFSPAGLWIGVLGLAVFLLHQPVKIVLKDYQKQKRLGRTIWAERFILSYGLLAVLALIMAVILAEGWFWPPFLLAVPFGLVQIYYDSKNQSRHVLAEMTGAVALGSIATAIALATKWGFASAMVLWIYLVGRSIPSILYIRGRLHLERDKPFARNLIYAVHILAILIIAVLVTAGFVPVIGLIAIIILALRAFWGLSPYRRSVRIAVIGMMELGYGLLYVVLFIVGYVT